MNSMTLEDIFCLNDVYENMYNDCLLCTGQCNCRYDKLVMPSTISRRDATTSLNHKSYISPTESCTICLNIISHKSNAYLTDCGHTFHRNCLSNYFQFIKLRDNSNLKCPMCRTNLGYPDFYDKYNLFNKNANGFDLIENLHVSNNANNANNTNNNMLHICNGLNTKHYTGMKKNCAKCVSYRHNG